MIPHTKLLHFDDAGASATARVSDRPTFSLCHQAIQLSEGKLIARKDRRNQGAASLPELIKKVKPSVVDHTYSSEEIGKGLVVASSSDQIKLFRTGVVDGCYRAEIKTSDGGLYPLREFWPPIE